MEVFDKVATATKLLKSPTTYEQQIEILKTRNLLISNEAQAIQILQRVSYYRLSAYFLSLKKERDLFKDGVTFEQAYRLYEFDIRVVTGTSPCVTAAAVSVFLFLLQRDPSVQLR